MNLMEQYNNLLTRYINAQTFFNFDLNELDIECKLRKPLLYIPFIFNLAIFQFCRWETETVYYISPVN